jgi:ABC-2 type transport system permease protein
LNTNRAIGNQDFFLNIVDYMMNENFMLDIRSRQIDVRQIDKVKIQQSANYYKMINMLVPIVLIILLGLVMNVMRKKRFTRK